MVKIKAVKLFFCIVLMASCTNRVQYNAETYALKIIYPDEIMVDYNGKKIYLEHEELKYSDSLPLSPSQQDIIESSFRNNEIGSLKGKFFYSREHAPQPPTFVTVRVFKNKKLLSEIQYDYFLEKGFWPFGQKYRALRFKEDILGILKDNPGIKKAIKIYGAYNDRLWHEHMRK